MMRVHGTEFDVGIIVGRFQCHELSEGHVDLLKHVTSQHDKVIVLLGLSPLMVTIRNPLDFEARKQMLLEAFPEVSVLYVKDVPGNDSMWSKAVDRVIGDVIGPNASVMLYGSRDSFIPAYTGRFPTTELEASSYISATEVRKKLARAPRASADWRAGVCWAAANQFPTTQTTVDVAVFSEGGGKILLARKEHEDKLRLIGGFSDPASPTFEADARREVQEEAGIAITDPEYVGSHKVDDLRYRGEVNQIKTILFRAKLLHGRPAPDDDICELHWVDVNSLRPDMIVDAHLPLMAMLFPHWHTIDPQMENA